MNLLALAGLLTGLAGAGAIYAGLRAGRPADATAAYLDELLAPAGGDRPPRPWDAPLRERLLRPVRVKAVALAGELTPATHLDRVHQSLLRAGLAQRVRAEEVVALNVATFAGALLVAALVVQQVAPPARLAVATVLLFGLIGAVLPQVWLERAGEERESAIQRALPDVLDLMAISVEAGVGLDSAMLVATEHMQNPLTTELTLALTEMELGLPRRQALQNLRRRVGVADVSNVVVALLQADELGMPIGHVLRLQAAEMRSKRRMRAREQAGKLPVKIVFPLVLFIFPPILVILIGPSVGDLAKAL